MFPARKVPGRGNRSALVVRRAGPTGTLLVYGMRILLFCTLSGEPGTGTLAPPGRELTHYPRRGTGRITSAGLNCRADGAGRARQS